MNSRRSKSSGADKSLPHEEQQAKINEVRRALGPSAADELPSLCSDGSIRRSLRARNWEADKASKMLKETMKWRLEYKPESIRWFIRSIDVYTIYEFIRSVESDHNRMDVYHLQEDVAREAETGKIYRANYLDKYGRTVLVMRPGFQNTSSTKGQIRYLVYCMENAILNLAADQEQMVWLIDFQGWSMASITIKVTRETAHVLQDYYPERLALGILYNPPRIFESFWKVVKPFLDQKTYKKVKFVYSDDTDSQKIMTDLFDINNLESAFGGRNQVGFDFNKYAEQMKEDDTKMSAIVNSAGSVLSQEPSLASILQQPEPSTSEALSQGSSDSSSPSDAESPKPVHTKNSKENKEKLNLNYDRGSAKLDVQPEPIKMRESA
ncbi:CRAL TRIO domain containing protein [Musa troglodytarum]|uniref:CRAL TRIO domain containing protein n=1 Tax=Musa troglodytarum TaxID=320322 RepID=A0A9E7GZQ4_9LILI|nr:CRAL TRIO domain containing protein [Musa troglodytarum]